ncbi:MAG TPA: RibD family protein [Fimbriimonadaceae bacterium]|nr:RibD family protein [Fimbriimonadaceae bacterium]
MSHIYDDLQFPAPPTDRPYTFINMVATIDGKTVIGDRNESVAGLGSKVDQELMDKIEAAADCVLLGAQTLRATSRNWNPKAPIRVAVTKSGKVPFDAKFFSAPEAQAYLACAAKSKVDPPESVQVIRAGKEEVDPQWLVRYLRSEIGVKNLHILGGSEINALFLEKDLVDELFLTLAPKVKLGRELPTYAGGHPLPKSSLQNYDLIEHHAVESEIFLRYRRRRD